MGNVLITGASGFIGGHLVEEGLRRGHHVYAAVRASSDRRYLGQSGLSLIELDFSDTVACSSGLSQLPALDYVIHGMGLTKALRPSDYFRSNTHHTEIFLKTLLALSAKPRKFIYLSSLSAQGPGQKTTPAPITTYGKSKLEAENFLTFFTGFPWLILRPTAVYGPREKDLYALFKLINAHLEPVIGSEKRVLSFVYVKDLVKLVFDAAESEISGKTYSVSDGNNYGRDDLALSIKKALGKKTIQVKVPLPLLEIISGLGRLVSGISGQPMAVNAEKLAELTAENWACDTAPLKKDFSFSPHYDLDLGVKETVAWYKENHWLK